VKGRGIRTVVGGETVYEYDAKEAKQKAA